MGSVRRSGVGSVRRSGVIIAMSSGLVASMALPAHAVSSAPVDASGAQTASIPAVPATGTGTAFFAAPSGSLLSLPDDVAGDNDPVTAARSLKIDFDHTALIAVPDGPDWGKDDFHSVDDAFDHKPAAGNDTDPHAAPVSRRAARTPSATNASGSMDRSDTSVAFHVTSAGIGASQVLSVASRYVGVQYRWGGTTPRGFDCSGYTQYVYRLLGKDIPRTVAEQRAAARIIPRSQARPGDLVIFGTSHIGIFAGNNMMYDAPHTGKSISLRSIYSSSVVFGRV